MVDTVQTNVLFDGTRRKIVQLLNLCDGTGESAVVKLDISADSGGPAYNGGVPTKYGIEEVEYDIQGFTYVRIDFDATTDDEALFLPPGSGYKDFRSVGAIVDPQTTGYTGDVVLTTAGNVAGDTYDIILHLRKYG